jgi:PAS domain S-box-containing protein
VPRPRTKLPILPEVQEAADRLAARRGLVGAAIYPFLALTLSLASGLQERRPYLFAFLLGAILALAAVRIYLTSGFARIYSARTRLWRAAFYGSLSLNSVLVGYLFGAVIAHFGLRVESFFTLTITAVIASMGMMVYSHAPRFLAFFVAALSVPPLLTLSRLPGIHPWGIFSWESLCLTVFFVYLAVFAGQLYRERWTGLTNAHLLAVRAGELERARDELRQAHDGLERLVDERALELRKANLDYRRIFENAHDAIFVLAPEDETILNANRRAGEIYGFRREELLGMSLADISEDVRRGRDHIATTMEQGVVHVFETTQFRRDGSRMFLEVNASLIEYEGRPAILSINRDLTERRRAEELRRAKEAAEQADRAKSQFLANMSHEIRTPMAGVLGLVDLLLRTDLAAQQRDYVALIQSSATSLLRLIDDILDFSKVEAGRLLLERVPFDLHGALSEIVELLRFHASTQGTELSLDVGEEVPRWVWGDPGRLRQVLTNLVGNAVKFTEGGRVEVEARGQADGRFRFAIRDTGIGIPAEAQGRLFELFSQADSSTSRRYGGSGLGLAISRRIVQEMAGEIGCESRPGEGSVFWFVLPLEAAEEPAAPLLPGEEKAAPRRSGRRHRILVAEDNLVNQLVVTQHLIAMGYDVLAVNNGKEALKVLERSPVDLVLMDCQMPELDGYEATRRIREGAGNSRGVPIVALTAHAMKEDLERCLAVGMNDIITKPFQKEVLERTLERWLSESPSTQQGAPPALDGGTLAELRELGRALGKDVIKGLAESFRSDTSVLKMRAGFVRGDRRLVGRAAHALKGSSACLGAVHLAALCEELERLPTEAAPEDYACRLAAIEEEYQRVAAGLLAAAAEGA